MAIMSLVPAFLGFSSRQCCITLQSLQNVVMPIILSDFSTWCI